MRTSRDSPNQQSNQHRSVLTDSSCKCRRALLPIRQARFRAAPLLAVAWAAATWLRRPTPPGSFRYSALLARTSSCCVRPLCERATCAFHERWQVPRPAQLQPHVRGVAFKGIALVRGQRTAVLERLKGQKGPVAEGTWLKRMSECDTQRAPQRGYRT